jgi:hypothetical protein
MERLSLSAFSSDLYHLNSDMYGKNIENCHAECVATGAVPIFHKHFGDNIVHRVTGDPLSSSSKSGTVWLDDDNMEQAAQLVFKLSSDSAMRDDYREMAFEFYKQHANSKDTVNDMLATVKEKLA